METLPITDLSIYGALTSVAVVAVAELTKFITKKAGVNISSRLIVLFLAIVVGSGYQAYTLYLSQATQDFIFAFVAGSVGFSTTIYTFLIKPLK